MIEAELDTGAAARRLRTEIGEVFGHPSDLVVVNGSGIRRGTRYVVRVVKDGDALARQTGPDRLARPTGPRAAGPGGQRRPLRLRRRLARARSWPTARSPSPAARWPSR